MTVGAFLPAIQNSLYPPQLSTAAYQQTANASRIFWRTQTAGPGVTRPPSIPRKLHNLHDLAVNSVFFCQKCEIMMRSRTSLQPDGALGDRHLRAFA